MLGQFLVSNNDSSGERNRSSSHSTHLSHNTQRASRSGVVNENIIEGGTELLPLKERVEPKISYIRKSRGISLERRCSHMADRWLALTPNSGRRRGGVLIA